MRLEKHEQAQGVQMLLSIGAAVYVSGTVRRRDDAYHGTMQTPGIPDVEAFLRVPGAAPARVLLKWEVKRAKGGRVSPAQAEYRQRCVEAGVAHVVGPFQALVDWLVAHGYVREQQLPAYRTQGVA